MIRRLTIAIVVPAMVSRFFVDFGKRIFTDNKV